MANDVLRIRDREFQSRLIVGTGKYASARQMIDAHEVSGAEMVTVALRRVNLTDRSKESLLDHIDTKKYFILPNTAGCYSADEAVRTAHLAREVGLSNWVKLEVIGDQETLFPDNQELIKATEILVREGFVVMPYTNDDLITARRLVDAGAAAIMPLGRTDRLGSGNSEPDQLADYAGENHDCPPDCGRRGRHGLRRHSGHGARFRRRADEQRHRPGARRGRDGRSYEACRHCRTPGFPCGAHGTQALRQRLQPSGRCGPVGTLTSTFSPMIGTNALPENYRKEIEAIAEEKFSFPNYSFNSLVESTLERAKKVFVEAGERKTPGPGALR